LAVDAGGVQAASGKAAGPADTGGCIGRSPTSPKAARRLGAVRRRRPVGRHGL